MIGTCRVNINPDEMGAGSGYITAAWCAITRLAAPDKLIQCTGASSAMVYDKLNLTVIECHHHLEMQYSVKMGITSASLSIDLNKNDPHCFWMSHEGNSEIPYEVKELFNSALKAVNAERMMFEDIPVMKRGE